MTVRIIGVPLDLGAGRRGVDMGPAAIRCAGLQEKLEEMGKQVEDVGNLVVPAIETRRIPDSSCLLKYLEEISQVNAELSDKVKNAFETGRFPLVLGGDHSVAIGSIAGAAEKVESLGILWFDAHGDFNTVETTPSGNIHGMPLAASAGLGDSRLVHCGGQGPKVNPENIVLIGIRSLDEGEKKNLRQAGAQVFTMADVDQLGIRKIVEDALEYLETRVDQIHLSFDMDVLNPDEAPGVGTPINGGLTYREAHLAMEMLAKSNRISSMDMVEVNPVLDVRNKTAELAVELILSALGKQIY